MELRNRIVKAIALFLAMAAVSATTALIVGAQNPPASVKTTTVLTKALPDIQGKEVRLILVDTAPGANAPAHRHPGHTFVYVIKGALETEVEGQPKATYKAGEVFYEPPNAIHAMSRNPSATEPSQALAIMVKDVEKPPTVPVIKPQAK